MTQWWCEHPATNGRFLFFLLYYAVVCNEKCYWTVEPVAYKVIHVLFASAFDVINNYFLRYIYSGNYLMDRKKEDYQ